MDVEDVGGMLAKEPHDDTGERGVAGVREWHSCRTQRSSLVEQPAAARRRRAHEGHVGGGQVLGGQVLGGQVHHVRTHPGRVH